VYNWYTMQGNQSSVPVCSTACKYTRSDELLFDAEEFEVVKYIRDEVRKRCGDIQPWLLLTRIESFDKTNYELSVMNKLGYRMTGEPIERIRAVVAELLETLTLPDKKEQDGEKEVN